MNEIQLKREALTEQQARVLRLREEGRSLEEIAAEFGLSTERVRQAAADGRRALKARASDPEGLTMLPKPVRQMLEWYELTTRAAVARLIDDGTFCWDEKWHRLRYGTKNPRNAGWKSWVVLHEWLGRPGPQSKRFMTCPHCGGRIPR